MSAKPKIEPGTDPKGKSKGKLLILVVTLGFAAVVVGLWFGGILSPLLGGAKAAKADTGKPATAAASAPAAPATVAPKPPVFVDLPDIVANLNAGPRRNVFLKLHVKLQLERAEDETAVTAVLPRLQDLFQTYLRDMRPEELRGSEGTYRLREELMARASLATSPVRVVDVLFTELLVQ